LKRRTLTIGLAVLLAVLGTAAVLAYVRQANNRALEGVQAVTVLVAEKGIPSGTSVGTAQSDRLLSSQKMPAASVPADALRSITPDLAGLVTSATVQPGQLLLRPMLVARAQATGGVAIPPGMIAVSIQLCLPEAVAGDIRAGSEVAVFDTFARTRTQLSAQPNCTGPHQQQTEAAHTQVVLPKVLVLSVGPAPAGQTGSSNAGVTVSSPAASSASTMLLTVALNQHDAERLIQLAEVGLPYLALLNPQSQTKFDGTLVPLH
jgi:pilus assembly protein CpaB